MKKRIDLLLVEKGYFESRERAKKAIMAGVVFVNNQRCDKAGVIACDVARSYAVNTAEFDRLARG